MNKDQLNASQSQEEKLKQLSQEVYFLVSDDEMYFIPYQAYLDREIGYLDIENPKGIFNSDGKLPANLYGPTLTKVLQWNIDEFVDKDIQQKQDLQTGYLLDLRTMFIPKVFISSKTLAENSIPQPASPPKIVAVPQDKRYELKQTPKQANLYIVSWQDPFADHPLEQLSPARVSYISYEDLQKYRVEAESVEFGTPTPEEKKVLVPYLKSYFIDAGVQTGSINPFDNFLVGIDNDADETSSDAEFKGIFLTCYIANVKSFNQS